jgi:hypothetical protein
MFSEEDKNIIRNRLKDTDVLFELNQTRFGVCEPSAKLTKQLVGDINDIVVLASDDFLCPQDWDKYLIDKLKGKEGVLIVPDGISDVAYAMQYPCVTIPILTFGALLKLNKVLYSTQYYHLYSDCELYLNAKELGLIIDIHKDKNEPIFQHYHHSIGARTADTNDQKYYNMKNEDENTWNNRKSMSTINRIITS